MAIIPSKWEPPNLNYFLGVKVTPHLYSLAPFAGESEGTWMFFCFWFKCGCEKWKNFKRTGKRYREGFTPRDHVWIKEYFGHVNLEFYEVHGLLEIRPYEAPDRVNGIPGRTREFKIPEKIINSALTLDDRIHAINIFTRTKAGKKYQKTAIRDKYGNLIVSRLEFDAIQILEAQSLLWNVREAENFLQILSSKKDRSQKDKIRYGQCRAIHLKMINGSKKPRGTDIMDYQARLKPTISGRVTEDGGGLQGAFKPFRRAMIDQFMVYNGGNLRNYDMDSSQLNGLYQLSKHEPLLRFMAINKRITAAKLGISVDLYKKVLYAIIFSAGSRFAIPVKLILKGIFQTTVKNELNPTVTIKPVNRTKRKKGKPTRTANLPTKPQDEGSIIPETSNTLQVGHRLEGKVIKTLMDKEEDGYQKHSFNRIHNEDRVLKSQIPASEQQNQDDEIPPKDGMDFFEPSDEIETEVSEMEFNEHENETPPPEMFETDEPEQDEIHDEYNHEEIQDEESSTGEPITGGNLQVGHRIEAKTVNTMMNTKEEWYKKHSFNTFNQCVKGVDFNKPLSITGFKVLISCGKSRVAKATRRMEAVHRTRLFDIMKPVIHALNYLFRDVMETAVPGEKQRLYITNTCGRRLYLDDDPRTKKPFTKYGLKKTVLAFMIQGLEAAIIHNFTILGAKYGYTPKSNQHDGLIVEGTIPPAAIDEVKKIVGVDFKLEVKQL